MYVNEGVNESFLSNVYYFRAYTALNSFGRKQTCALVANGM